MSFWKSLFGDKQHTIRDEIMKRAQKVKTERVSKEEAIFLTVFGGACRLNVIPHLHDDRNAQQKYQSNSAVFELASYLYFHADLHLFARHAECKHHIDYIMEEQFFELFDGRLQFSTHELYEQMQDRFNYYSQLNRDPTLSDSQRAGQAIKMLRTALFFAVNSKDRQPIKGLGVLAAPMFSIPVNVLADLSSAVLAWLIAFAQPMTVGIDLIVDDMQETLPWHLTKNADRW